MNKIIGFSLTYGELPPVPAYLADYPWLSKIYYVYTNGFYATFWGHGQMLKLLDEKGITICHDSRYAMDPLQSTGIILEGVGKNIKVHGNALKGPPVYYGTKGGKPFVSTSEECVLEGLGGATLGKGRLVSFLIHQAAVGTLTLWDEINQMDANSDLIVRPSGEFKTQYRAPMTFPEVDPADYVDMLREVIQSYTKPLGDIHLAMSSGYDSRLVLTLADRPERINTWTVPLGKPEEHNAEYVWAKRTAELLGASHNMVKFDDGLAPYMKPFIEYGGATLSGLTGYMFGLVARANQGKRFPMLSGIMADSVAGSGYNDLIARGVEDLPQSQQFTAICRDWGDMRWTEDRLDTVLAFDWKKEFGKISPRLTAIWRATEGPNFQARAALLRIRNRTANVLRPAFAGADLWGGAVVPYADTRYISWMLALPEEFRQGRKLVIDTTTTEWPAIFNRPSGLTDDSYDSTNTLDEDIACDPWPGPFEHSFFKPIQLLEIYLGAEKRDMPSIRQAWALQPIAWAMKRGYVR